MRFLIESVCITVYGDLMAKKKRGKTYGRDNPARGYGKVESSPVTGKVGIRTKLTEIVPIGRNSPPKRKT